MKKILAFGDEKDAVLYAFSQMGLKEEIQEQPLYAKPSEKAQVVGIATSSEGFVVGVYGDEWYIILTSEGTVGYAPQASCWAGNG